ncbi:MAG: LLM class flavin-dependent oxidoreductase [Stellaceae bacterium]
MNRQMVMVGFLQAQNCTNIPASWRHPESRTDFTAPEYYAQIARVLEAGKFHLAFFDDRLAMPDRYGGDHAHTVEFGIRCVKLDPIVVMMTMAAVTSRLGLGATCSTTYYEPFHVARLFQTVDLMTHGRAAWNVVTSVNDGEALNMGRSEPIAHDLRYDRADEFMEIVLGHWDSWDDDALILDKKRGRFADPEKVRRLDYEGKHYHSRGPFTVPRSAQGHPVIIQAGQSGRGTRFAGRWAEVVFSSGGNAARAKEIYSSLRDEIAKCGRDPDQVAICNAITIVAGESQGDAEDKMAVIEKLPLEIDQLSLLAEGVNFDFAGRDLDAPLSDADLASFSGMLTIRDSVIRASGKKNPSTRDFITINHRGKVSDAVVGGPKEVADRLEEMFVDRHCDGFVVAATHIPGAYADFVRHVVPELQRRGLYHDDYAGPTLRDNLGLPPPRIGDWK